MKSNQQIIIKRTPDLFHECARIISLGAKKGVKERDRFVMAVSGGSSPRPIYRLLRKEPYFSEIPWIKTHIFWVDERCVPYDSPDSNYGCIKEDLLDFIPIPSHQIHKMPVQNTPSEGASIYESEILDFFRPEKGALPRFDLILLGVGTDGHTASLFPGDTALEESVRLILAVKGGNPDVHRLTMTFPLLNGAEKLLFIAVGKKKAGIIDTVFNALYKRLPVQLINSENGDQIWLLDQEASSLLMKGKK